MKYIATEMDENDMQSTAKGKLIVDWEAPVFINPVIPIDNRNSNRQ